MKKVIVKIKNDEITISFDGYVGRECFVDAQKIDAILDKLGLKIKTKTIRPIKYEHVIDGIHVENGR